MPSTPVGRIFHLLFLPQWGILMVMRLLDHLKERGETVADFAKRAQEAETTIRKIVYGQRQPSLPLAVKIASLTAGAVTEADLLIAPQAAA